MKYKLLEELLPYLEGKKSGKVVGITFDDGYQNNVSNALPILSKLGFSATCFIVSGNIGGFNHWDISKGVSKKRMMSEHDIRRWIDSGMEIGSHSQNHIRLSEYDQTTIENEVLGSKRILADKFNTTVDHFCYPYGDKSDKVEEVVKNSGYKTACSVVRGKTYLSSNLLSLPRVLVNHRTFPLLFVIKILSKYEDGR